MINQATITSSRSPRSSASLRTGSSAVHSNAVSPQRIDAEYVVSRLEEAGASLLALPDSGWTTKLRSSTVELVRTTAEAYGRAGARIRPAVPSAEKITRMDEAMGWLQLIPDDRFLLRRVAGARSLVHPITERHLFAWRRLGTALGADHKAVQRWHSEAINIIVVSLNRRR